jgi:multiple sugar transport system substrate-binding protein
VKTKTPHQITTRLISHLCLAFACTLVAVGGATVQAAGHRATSITLTYAGWDPPDILGDIVAPCLKQLPGVNVKLQFIPQNGYEAKLQTDFAAGVAPDVFYSLEYDALKWAKAGDIINQLPRLKQLGVSVSNILPAAQWWYKGQYLGTSSSITDLVLYYNKVVFKQAHVATPPADVAHAWTWPQFVRVAEELTIDNKRRHPYDAGFDPNHIERYGVTFGGTDWFHLLPLVYSNGGNVLDAANRHFAMNQPVAADAIQAWADLANKYHVMPTPTESASGAGSISLASQRVAMQFDGTYMLWFFQHTSHDTRSTAAFPLGMGVLPKFKQYRTDIAGTGMVAYAHSAHPQQALQLAMCISATGGKSFADAKAIQRRIFKEGIGIPNQYALLTGANYKLWAANAFHPATFRTAAIDTLKYAPEQVPYKTTTQFGTIWNTLITPALDQVINGQTSARAALNGIAPQANALLAQGQ